MKTLNVFKILDRFNFYQTWDKNFKKTFRFFVKRKLQLNSES